VNFDLQEAVAILERTPQALRALLAGLPPAWIQADEGPEPVSPRSRAQRSGARPRSGIESRGRKAFAGSLCP
jgi:hypothetical protein